MSHELDAPPWLRVESTLMAAARLVRLAYDRRLASLDLNLTQAIVLAYASDFGPVNQSTIARHLGQGRAATGVCVDRLEERGLLRREADPDDRRVWRIAVTTEGRRLTVELAEVDKQLRTEFRTGISRSERQMLARVLGQLVANLEGVLEDSSGDSRSVADEGLDP